MRNMHYERVSLARRGGSWRMSYRAVYDADRRGLGEQIEQAGRTPSDIAALASQLAAKPGDDGGAGGKRI